jgi:hypothetical protein
LWPKGLDGDGLLFYAHRLEKGRELHFFTDPVKVILAHIHDFQAIASYGPPTRKTLDALTVLLEKHEIEKVEIL